MVSSTNNIFWSPSNQFLSYLVTNDNGVEVIEFTKYGQTQYPETIDVTYPKAGTKTPTVDLRVYDTVQNTTISITAPSHVGTDHIFCRLQWYSDSKAFLVFWLNRIQNKAFPQMCEYDNTTAKWNCEVVESGIEESSTGWIGVGGSPFRPILRDTKDRSYFGVFSYDGFFHVALVNPETNTKNQKTTGIDGVIASLQRYDPTNEILYFIAAYPLPRQRILYSISTNEENPIAELDWIPTGQEIEDRKERCKWNTPSFSQGNKYMVINCGGPDVPMSVLYRQQNDGAYLEIEVVQNNDDLIANKAGVKWPTKEYGTFASTSGVDILYQVYKPKDFDSEKKYPMLIEVYGGPGYQKVLDRWTRGWAAVHMVSQYDIVVVMLDARGSGYRGDGIAHLLYKKNGQLEKIDTTEVAQYFAQQSWIDESRVAIWGWSYGGYTTTFTISEGSGVFKCGFAVAPLATRFLYDSIHTERYMTLPENNTDGYEKCSILNSNLSNFKKASYSIIHGTADDNVHFQNAALISKALVKEGVDFDNFYYADEAHSVNTGVNANRHIYKLLTRKVRTCFNLSPPTATKAKSSSTNALLFPNLGFESLGYTKPECDQTKYFDHLN